MPKLFHNRSNSSASYKCTVRLLEDTESLECEIDATHKGKYLLDYVCKELDLIEKDYFGLRYVDSQDQRQWLDLSKSIIKQVKDLDPIIILSFRVKFYPPSMIQLKEKITQYQLYLQLKRDLLHGRLCCTAEEASWLGACILQAELGDYNEDLADNYASEVCVVLDQTPEIETRMTQIHKMQMKGIPVEVVELQFIQKASSLEMYAIDPHPVKDLRGNQLFIGMNFSGVLTFQNGVKTSHFKWSEVHKINFEGKMFIIHRVYQEKKHTVGYKCLTSAACKYLWRCAVEQMLFFTSTSSSSVPRIVTGGSFFSRGSKLRYTGRVEKELLAEMSKSQRDEPTIKRVGSIRKKPNNLARSTSAINSFVDGYGLQNGERSGSECEMISMRSSATDGFSVLDSVLEDSDALIGAETENIAKQDDSFMDEIKPSTVRSSTPVGERVPSGSEMARPPLDESVSEKTNKKLPLRSHFGEAKRVLCPTLLFTLFTFFLVAVIIFETDCEMLTLIRKFPELVHVRRHYYEPCKNYAMRLLDDIAHLF